MKAIVKKGKRVVLVVDDNSRMTPTRKILPLLLERIKQSGVTHNNVTIIVALGTHRKMTEKELREKLGEEVSEKYTVIQHEYNDPDELRLAGTFKDIPMRINRHYLKVDILIGIGDIVPHEISGWSGRSKFSHQASLKRVQPLKCIISGY